MTKVLVVDDSPLVRIVLCDYLHDLGCEALPAHTAEEALSLCRTHRPDLVIKDLIMEGTDTYVLMAELRDIIPNLPIVICSTIGRRSEICAAIRKGANDYLIKPFGLAEVANLLQHQIAR